MNFLAFAVGSTMFVFITIIFDSSGASQTKLIAQVDIFALLLVYVYMMRSAAFGMVLAMRTLWLRLWWSYHKGSDGARRRSLGRSRLHHAPRYFKVSACLASS
ncbi:hypothetical protein CYMTET_34049 [Cymbomonas tetramitiformis]|uniref:Uncharacterized protein n=1 Tax=Cymbomonas tetramitiformis TaxID=36881 RepID=A0AAE0FC01_9CHLO|nr:hypothetical protein CYMTET_34049 [Cymbomonas tetramitiformis]